MQLSRDKKKPVPPTQGFRAEFLDFARGIRVGHLEPHQRITQILKRALEKLYREDFLIDRYGRGVYWQWICFLPKANRSAKPLSSHYNFGCSKFFIQIERDPPLFKSGLHIERGLTQDSEGRLTYQLQKDWDWQKLMRGLTARSPLYQQLRHLVLRDGFHLYAGSRNNHTRYSRQDFPSATQLRRALLQCPAREWAVFQLYYPMNPQEVSLSSGPDLVDAILAVFREVTPAMNECMQTSLDTAD